jgi:hypothetical protein
MQVTFLPANPARNPSSVDPKTGPGVPMVHGQVYDIAPEWVAHINASSPGVDGGPSCVPVVEPAEPKAEKPKAGAKKAEKPAPVATPDPAVEET